ncbi:flagellar M-ring protein FliF C-terminal domain-containing protein [Vampirovibrio sp.]|uniref:flagellar M-ring protein FliF C-terminal domain-containing protein n=1 Tax=Vampirovibrio sp. TaxID=2717857 RepID=UPI00359449A8
MPPQIQAIMQDKRMLAIIAGILGLILIVAVVLIVINNAPKNPGEEKLGDPIESRKLALVTSTGKAIEIQALLARENIRLESTGEGDKVTLLFEKGTTKNERDRALITLVQSGLMDKHVGLEAFDKGDLTASREEKRIKLIRSQQGEIARLIKKIDPIEDASVNIAIPEQTLFRSEIQPMSATVQVTIPSGTRLSKPKIKAITNLVVGSLQGLDSSHVTVTDTNGNTYSSVLDNGTEINEKIEEQDSYMQQKVATQLDRLVGTGNYVVTVSTEVRQAAKETMTQEFDPQGAVVSTKQAFNENLNSNGTGPAAGGPTSSFLPNSLHSAVIGGKNNKDYNRNGVEVAYSNSKTQWVETRPVGMIEDISIAVTIDANHFPGGMSVNELQVLLAKAASPKMRPENVSIARSDMQKFAPASASGSDGMDGGGSGTSGNLSWIYWAGGAVLLCLLAIVLLNMQKGGQKIPEEAMVHAQQELQQLREFANQQQAQLQATQQQTQMILEAQQKQMQQAQALENTVLESQRRIATSGGIQQTLESFKDVVSEEDLEDDTLDLEIKSWIESS